MQPSEEADVNTWLNTWLQDVTRQTLVLWRNQNAVTLATGTSSYSLLDTAVFDRPMFEISVFVVNKVILRNLSGEANEDDPILFAIANPTYQTDAQGAPAKYLADGPETIIVYPTPDDDYEGFCVGYGLHYEMTGDSDVLELPSNYLEDAADYCAMRWLAQSNPLELYANEWQRVNANFAALRASNVGRAMMKRPRGDTGRRLIMTGATRWPV